MPHDPPDSQLLSGAIDLAPLSRGLKKIPKIQKQI